MTASDLLREEFRDWLANNLPPEFCKRAIPHVVPHGRHDPEGVRICLEWQRMLHAGGWVAPGWPKEYGGMELDLEDQLMIAEELTLARAPMLIGFQGIDILGPALLEHGTEEQKQRYIPRILSAEDIWCQGYSEPDAGSDLSSIRTTARRDGDHYIVNGQKIWTSFGDRANWCFLLARTGSPDSRHRGISFFVVEMSTPGIEWRALTEITGGDDFGETFFDEVSIPADQRIGPENEGWRVAMSSLGPERLMASNVAAVTVRYNALLDLFRKYGSSAAARDRAMSIGSRLVGLQGLQRQALTKFGQLDFGPWTSLVKLSGSEVRKDIAALALEVVGTASVANRLDGAVPTHADDLATWEYEFLHCPAGTIYAGSSEVQRNIIAERGLGLPKDPA